MKYNESQEYYQYFDAGWQKIKQLGSGTPHTHRKHLLREIKDISLRAVQSAGLAGQKPGGL